MATLNSQNIEPGVNQQYVDNAIAAINAKEFMSIDSSTGNFMLPVAKSDDATPVQLYMRLTVYNLDGDYTPMFDGVLYTKTAEGVFTPYSP